MKNFLKITTFVLLIGIQSCTETVVDPANNSSGSASNGSSSTGNSSTSKLGNYSFYTKSDLGMGNIYIYINNEYKGTISHYNSTGITCGKSDVNVTMPAGTYSFYAKSDGNSTWENTLKWSNNNCTSMELTKGSSSSGSGNTGGGTTTTKNTGTTTFYSKTDLGHGNIKVYVNNVYYGTISHYHSAISCGKGDVNVELSPGSYAYSAVSDDGYNWGANFTVTAGQCSLRQLTN